MSNPQKKSSAVYAVIVVLCVITLILCILYGLLLYGFYGSTKEIIVTAGIAGAACLLAIILTVLLYKEDVRSKSKPK
ncbi:MULTISPECIES: hypothetical protein [unclassified Paenibacillus]|uniref:hypothetical protein n=1 Tax=unclassified Paenibacillus TaxID=185978 RepID=UPI0010539070|nr:MULTISPECIES: hypothetical protein [unclassified Paenibacillus]NIK71899.1 amino acid permease [Paenibacillus sp. BK720]TCM96546.1 hypothetical protein EV294_105413 [Paenibacillus sp. BK033]